MVLPTQDKKTREEIINLIKATVESANNQFSAEEYLVADTILLYMERLGYHIDNPIK
jgi:hypothetical protein